MPRAFDAVAAVFTGSCVLRRSALTAKSRRKTPKLSVTPGLQCGRGFASSLEDNLAFVRFVCVTASALFSIIYKNGIGLALTSLADLSRQGRST